MTEEHPAAPPPGLVPIRSLGSHHRPRIEAHLRMSVPEIREVRALDPDRTPDA